jgi:hypothetical protein
VGVPELSGTEASLATMSERIASSAKRDTASASTNYALLTRDGVGNHISRQHRRQSVETFDRQDKYRFACCGDENRPSSVEFAKAAADTGVPPTAK